VTFGTLAGKFCASRRAGPSLHGIHQAGAGAKHGGARGLPAMPDVSGAARRFGHELFSGFGEIAQSRARVALSRALSGVRLLRAGPGDGRRCAHALLRENGPVSSPRPREAARAARLGFAGCLSAGLRTAAVAAAAVAAAAAAAGTGSRSGNDSGLASPFQKRGIAC